jgi:flagellar biosynthesis/type III secretory pathway protein FliH
MAVKTMDELGRRRLQAVDRFIASLTPEQQALMTVGALRENRLTPHQKSLAEEMGRTVPEGMTPEQASEWTRQLTLEENRERFQQGFQRGWEDGGTQIRKLKWIGFAIGCCIAILILLARC